MGGSDQWSSTLLLDHRGAPEKSLNGHVSCQMSNSIIEQKTTFKSLDVHFYEVI